MGKMKPYWKRLWLASLRSGNYKQTRGVLRRIRSGLPDRFCCLGVLGDLQQSPRAKWKLSGSGQTRLLEGREGHLSGELKQKFGLDDDAADTLIGMNDGNRRFKTIANWIEKNL